MGSKCWPVPQRSGPCSFVTGGYLFFCLIHLDHPYPSLEVEGYTHAESGGERANQWLVAGFSGTLTGRMRQRDCDTKSRGGLERCPCIQRFNKGPFQVRKDVPSFSHREGGINITLLTGSVCFQPDGNPREKKGDRGSFKIERGVKRSSGVFCETGTRSLHRNKPGFITFIAAGTSFFWICGHSQTSTPGPTHYTPSPRNRRWGVLQG